MYKFFIPILMISFLFVGCSQKQNEHVKPTDILHEQSLTQTQKTLLKEGLETKVFFVTTYISHIEHHLINPDEKLERFIVSVYVPSDGDKTIYNKLFFKINSNEITDVKELKKDNSLLSLLPALNPWSKYFIVQTPIDDDKIGVFFEAGATNLGSTQMEFHDRYGNLPFSRSKENK